MNSVQDQLDQFINLLETANQQVNLVSRKDIANVREHHVKPSLYYLELECIQPGDHILDIGSGGGFPGMIIAIMQPETQVTLVESIGKKSLFLESAVGTLGLKNVTVLNKRAEALAHNSKYRKQMDHVTARGVAPLAQLWDWAKPLLKPEGTLEAMKGLSAAEREVVDLLAADYDIIQYPDTETVIVSVYSAQ